MANSKLTDLIDCVLLMGPATQLEDLGWTKSEHRRTFRHATDECIQVLDVQASQWNTGRTGTFTINLGVHFPAASDVLQWATPHAPARSRDEDRIPLASDCHMFQRIGQIMPTGQDHWWAVSASADVGDLSVLGVDVGEAIALWALPWFRRRSTLQAASACALLEGRVLLSVALAIATGDLDLAMTRTEAAVASGRFAFQHDQLTRLRQRFAY